MYQETAVKVRGKYMGAVIAKQLEVDKVYNELKSMNEMCALADKVEALDETTAKMVLKKFIYAARQ